jgi:hypothetical protein
LRFLRLWRRTSRSCSSIAERCSRRRSGRSPRIGSGPLEIGARFIAFSLVIAGAAVMPGHRAARRVPVDTPANVTASQGRS